MGIAMQNKAVFLDRDGVINRETGDFVYETDKFSFNPGIFDSLLRLQENGFMLIVITNQSGVSAGRYTHKHVGRIHAKMIEELSSRGIFISAVYYCPHHPSTGKCLCRKPKSLLVEKASARFDIDPSRSFMIGDRERDTEAASGAGVKGFLINSNAPIDWCVDIIVSEKATDSKSPL